jgi:hypothetical protein
MVFNATFNNISIIYPEKIIDLPQVTGKPYGITPRHEYDTNTNLVVIGTYYIGSCKPTTIRIQRPLDIFAYLYTI